MESKHWLLQIPFFKGIFLAASIIYCVAPGIIYCFINFKDLFEKTDLLKLLLLTTSFSTMIYGVNYFMILLVIGVSTNKKLDDEQVYTVSAQVLINLYTILFFINLCDYVFYNEIMSIKAAVIFFYILVLIIVIGGTISYIENKIYLRRQRNKK